MHFLRLLHLSLLPVLAYTQVEDYWITSINKTDFYKPLTFFCNTSLSLSPMPENVTYSPRKWMFNDYSNLDNGQTDGRRLVGPSGYLMTILNVSERDFGVYHCMLYSSDAPKHQEWWLIKLGLNMRGPYYDDLWEKYRLNTIIGLSAFTGFLALAIAIMCIYSHRYISEADEVIDGYEEKKHSRDTENNNSIAVQSFDNKSYIKDVDEPQNSRAYDEPHPDYY